MSMVDRAWLNEKLPNANILNCASGVSVQGFDNKPEVTHSYIVLQVFITGINGLFPGIRIKFHIVPSLRCKVIIGLDIIEPENNMFNHFARRATNKSCNGFTFEVKVSPKGRDILHGQVRTAMRIDVKLNFEFTPLYHSSAPALYDYGPFFRSIVNSNSKGSVFRKLLNHAITDHKNMKHNCIEDDPDQFLDLINAAKNRVCNICHVGVGVYRPRTSLLRQTYVIVDEIVACDSTEPAAVLVVDINSADDVSEEQVD
ncbi:hypothetical protein EDC01DRAFT_636477 [Geopyxis carbonaria]|nr:hypothetical protein EDC01DRAFT_636477 [Geopyxis carbonaria]